MRFGSFLSAVAAALLLSGVASAESGVLHLSIGINAIEPVDATSANASDLSRNVLDRRVELGLHFLPAFLVREPRGERDPLSNLGESRVEPEWRRIRIVTAERVSLRLPGFGPPPLPLVTVDQATRQLEELDPVRIVPILEPVRVLTSVLATQANELIARGMSVEVGDHVESRYAPLHGLAGDIQRGQYLRADDVTGRQFNFDVRLVIAWRPNDLIRLEAGYALAYLSGETRSDFGATGPLGDRNTSYLVHGPCATINFDF